jgi:hypothetical protein
VAKGTKPIVAFWLVLSLSQGTEAAGQRAVNITWDEDLAFENDRGNYEKMIHGIVNRAWHSVTQGTGIVPKRPVQLHVYTPARYEKAYGSRAAFRRGAHYFRGAIHVNGGNRLNTRFAGKIEHEMFHAVVDHQGTGHALPMWLNEGLAESFQWRRLGHTGLAPNQVNELKRAQKGKKLVPLPARGTPTPYQYLLGYAAVLFMEKRHGREKLNQLVRETIETRSFRQSLKKVLRTEMKYLEREFDAWVKDLD